MDNADLANRAVVTVAGSNLLYLAVNNRLAYTDGTLGGITDGLHTCALLRCSFDGESLAVIPQCIEDEVSFHFPGAFSLKAFAKETGSTRCFMEILCPQGNLSIEWIEKIKKKLCRLANQAWSSLEVVID